MNTHDIELPAEFRSGNGIPVTQATIKRERMEEILRDAIDAARTRRGEPVAWRPIDTAPTDNKRPLYLARFHEGELVELDFNGGWEYWQESYEMPHINGYAWKSNNGIEDPTHWAYQEDPLPTTAPQPSEPSDSLPRHVAQTLATAIYRAAQKMGIANRDHSTLSVPQCLHLLDCMSQPAEPVRVPSDAQLKEFWRQLTEAGGDEVDFARALLARYGQS